MRILIGRDYYDIGLGAGHDDTLVFHRREDWLLSAKEMAVIGLPNLRSLMLPVRSIHDKYGTTYTDKPFILNRQTYQIYPVIVGFCGKLYQAYATVSDHAAPIVHWQEADMMAWLASHEIEVATGILNTRTIKSVYQGTITPAIYGWMLAERVTVFSYVGDHPENVWRINAPSLKQTQFYKVFDPYAAFQEIAMWVGGVLSGTENPTVQITDDVMKAEKHGFDKKLSFRKAKTRK